MARTVLSLQHQTVADIEVIVVDDGSSDGTVTAVSAIEDPRLVIHRQVRAGPGAARNAGAALARAPVLAFVDSDDEADPLWAERLLSSFSDPRCAAACCGARRRRVRGGEDWAVMPAPLGPAFGCFTGLFNAGTFAVRASAFSAIGGYAERLRFSENTELALRLTARCRDERWTITVVSETLLTWNVRDQWDYPPQLLLDATSYIIEKHRAALATDRTLLADYEAICGVNAARLGQLRVARRHLAGAFRAKPSRRAAGRLAAAIIPPVSRRVWARSGGVTRR